MMFGVGLCVVLGPQGFLEGGNRNLWLKSNCGGVDFESWVGPGLLQLETRGQIMMFGL